MVDVGMSENARQQHIVYLLWHIKKLRALQSFLTYNEKSSSFTLVWRLPKRKIVEKGKK
jgi:hypothetical protein